MNNLIYVNLDRNLAIVVAAWLKAKKSYTVNTNLDPAGSLATYVGNLSARVAITVNTKTKFVEWWSSQPWLVKNTSAPVWGVTDLNDFIKKFEAAMVFLPAPKSWAVGCKTIRVSDDGRSLILGAGLGETVITRAQVQEVLDAMNPPKKKFQFGIRRVEVISGGKELSIANGETYVTRAVVEDMLKALKA